MSLAAPAAQCAAIGTARFLFADALRGLAALWVVLFHMREGHHIETLLATLPKPIEIGLFAAGHLGVAIFFVLSGFVMRLNAGSRWFGPRQAGEFMVRRLVRLAPPYYFAIAVTVALLFLKARMAHAALPEITGLQWLSHLTFTTGILEQPFLNIVYWTLCVEIQFYIAFALMLLAADALGRHAQAPEMVRTGTFSIVAAAALLWPLGAVQTSGWPGGFVGFWYSFMAGVLVGQARGGQSVARLACGAYVLILLACAGWRQDAFAMVAGLTAIALWLAQSGRAPRVPGSGWRGWAFLGMVSYSLYLLHNPVTGVVFNVLRRSGITAVWMDALSAAIAVAACLVASYLAYRWVERPAMGWSRQVRLSGPPRT